MVLEEVTLLFKSSVDRFGGFDVALTTINHWDIPQSQGNDTASQNINNICAGIPSSYGFVEDRMAEQWKTLT